MVKIHFRYGSKPKKEFPNEKKVFGGILGGHVYIQLDNNYYGFEPKNEKLNHFFPNKKYNSKFKRETEEEWIVSEKGKKILSINLDLNKNQELQLFELLENYRKNSPYDYAVLGMRCAASTHHILSQIGFFPKSNKLKSMILNPYPRFLRNRLKKLAKRFDWEIKLQEGKQTRTWERN